jgi:predicted nucleic acid-binding protein
VVVDTTPVIYLLEDRAPFADRFAGLFDAAARAELSIVVSPMTVAEVLAGPLRAGQQALAQRYEAALAHFELVLFDARLAARAARLRARYRSKLPDAIQIATALECSADSFVTYDRDCARVEGIRLITGDQ